jgi:preprotein translocase subunit SecY
VGFRLTKWITGLAFVLAGAYFFLGDYRVEGDVPQSVEFAGVVLALAGAYFLARQVKEFDLFRIGLSAIGGAIGVYLVTDGVTELLSGELGTELAAPILQIAGALAIAGALYFSLWMESNIHRVLENIFAVPELLNKLLFTLGLLAIYRIGFHVPLPGLNNAALEELAKQQQTGGGIFGDAMQYFSMFTGGSLGQSTLFGLGIMPYISASIIFTLLVNVIPALERLQKEGPAGYKKIQEYTRYATVGLCIIQASFYMAYLRSARVGTDFLIYPELLQSHPTLIFITGVIGLTTGTIFLMWLGEQIDEYGIGNGISLLIMAGIVVRVPSAIRDLAMRSSLSLTAGEGELGLMSILFLIASFVFVVAGAILITQGQRRIPIQQAKQTRGRRVYGGQRHYMPLRVNHGGVMPIIFASSLMIFPGVITGWASSNWQNNFTVALQSFFQNGSWGYTVVYIGMIFFFAYFWTTVQFKPKEMADQLRNMGHFIPGLRPGKRTAEYLERVMERITYCGAAFLAVIAVLPTIIATKLGIPFSISGFLGGTGLLIMVSVTLDLVQRIESNLVMRNYGGFLGGSTRIKGARG